MDQPAPSDRSSWLDRKPWGLSNWLMVAMIALLAIGLTPRGLRRAVEGNTNNAEDWLPADYPESTDLRWLADRFVSAQFVLVSWDGCTLGDTERLRLLEQKLQHETTPAGAPMFGRIVTGPGMVAKLTEAPANLERAQAIDRLEGALVGPAPVSDAGESLGDQARTTCLVAWLSQASLGNNRSMRAAVERAHEIVETECGVAAANIHLGGPPVDNVTIDIEGERTLRSLALYSGLLGIGLAYWCFRDLRLTLVVFAGAGLSAGLSLAIVYYFGVFEVLALGRDKPLYGSVDAILMSMPAVVYVLGLSGGIHLVNYYRDERAAHGRWGAVERAVAVSWAPCALAAFTTAVGLGSLAASDIIPIKKFGMFTASGVLATVGMLFSLVPVYLHLFPPKDAPGEQAKKKHQPSLPAWATRYAEYVVGHSNRVTFGCLALMAVMALGLPKITTSVQILKLLDEDVDLIHDYAWLERHIGNLVPMEVIVALPPENLRGPAEHPEDGGDCYRMTMVERLDLVRRIGAAVEQLDPVSRALSAATFGPAEVAPGQTASVRRGAEYAASTAMQENREALGDYLRMEGPDENARELWRVSARLAALSDIDYGQFVGELRAKVEPVLAAYRLRDALTARLHAQGKRLEGSRVCVAFAGEAAENAPAQQSESALLMDLLAESGVRNTVGGARGVLQPLNVTRLGAASPEAREKLEQGLAGFDAVVALDRPTLQAVDALLPEGVALLPPGLDSPPAGPQSVRADQPVIASIYSGIVPLVYKTQRELLISLFQSIGWATVLIACVMAVLLRSVRAGAVSMLPNVFPIILVFGAMGWLGVKVDIGIMMCASVALGVAVDDTLHFLTWFRRGVVEGLDRRAATLGAFERCGVAMCETTLIAGLGLAVFAVSTFTPTQQFGSLMIIILGAALVGDLLMLPAILCGPLGRCFAPNENRPAQPEEASPRHEGPRLARQPEPLEPPATPRPAPEAEATPSAGVPAAAPSRVDPPTPRAEGPMAPDHARLFNKLQGMRRSDPHGPTR
ncbi:MMPL family protein [Pirellulimonas nuda]|uniref:MMPL family protein n=1 Tax=Pirellulimonas nuda TaxID=2528009 RepID=A0A518DH52_9BACT|nr:MMPL family transporter [Pirellulimonas nuda]QDU90796.1 MMPL family protein [Pirellulimonas nuda]